jgi:hypothetical protein
MASNELAGDTPANKDAVDAAMAQQWLMTMLVRLADLFAFAGEPS